MFTRVFSPEPGISFFLFFWNSLEGNTTQLLEASFSGIPNSFKRISEQQPFSWLVEVLRQQKNFVQRHCIVVVGSTKKVWRASTTRVEFSYQKEDAFHVARDRAEEHTHDGIQIFAQEKSSESFHRIPSHSLLWIVGYLE